MLEHESLISLEKSSNIRSTNYLSFVNQFAQNLQLKGTLYYQPLLKDLSNYRFSAQLNKSIMVNKFISLNNILQYKFYSHLSQNFKNSDLFLSSSMSISF